MSTLASCMPSSYLTSHGTSNTNRIRSAHSHRLEKYITDALSGHRERTGSRPRHTGGWRFSPVVVRREPDLLHMHFHRLSRS